MEMFFVVVVRHNEKFGEKNGVFGSKQRKIIKKFDHNIGF
jgi:hypothetical protein